MGKLPSNPSQPVVVMPGEGESHEIGPSKITHKVDGAANGGHFGMIEYRVAPRFVAPTMWHWHTKECWTAYVALGQLRVAFLDRQIEVPTGGTIVVPANCPFAWSNPSDEPATLISIYAPAGFENYFRAISSVLQQHPGVSVKDLGPQLTPLWNQYGIGSGDGS
jgi:mannose-6-phosphate isomerase-like protein (cupin superfamily)